MKRLAIALAFTFVAAGAAGHAAAAPAAQDVLPPLAPAPAADGAYCASTAKTIPGLVKPLSTARILIFTPDVELKILTMAGGMEPRADWSQQGRDNIAGELASTIKAGGHPFQTLAAADAMEGHNGQMLRLHEAVSGSILTFNYLGYKLPTKKTGFDWTLGEGAKVLGETYGADYALFTYARGSWSSGGRKAAWLAMAALGASIPLGGQTAAASLVDLKTGQIIWFNMTTASPTADMRTPTGAAALTKALLKDLPL